MNEGERDRQLDAAWRAASHEEPPPALDAALRAAARRAVEAAPGDRRGKHWWYPLAAAATVALLAIGIVQLTPPERVTPANVTDMAAASPKPKKDAARQAEPVDARREAPPAAAPTPEAHAPAPAAAGAVASPRGSERARVVAAKPLPPAAGAKAESAPQDQLAGGAPAIAAANSPPPASAAAPAPPATRPSEPFPAAAPAQPRRDTYLKERGQADNALAQTAPEPAAMQSQAAARKVAPAEEAKVADGSARNVEEWIKRIRDLKNAGRLDEAAKELALFRSAYGERAEGLLPADLRQIKP